MSKLKWDFFQQQKCNKEFFFQIKFYRNGDKRSIYLFIEICIKARNAPNFISSLNIYSISVVSLFEKFLNIYVRTILLGLRWLCVFSIQNADSVWRWYWIRKTCRSYAIAFSSTQKVRLLAAICIYACSHPYRWLQTRVVLMKFIDWWELT